MGKYVISEKTIRRFWAKVDLCAHGKTCKECCWEWTGMKKGRTKYGRFTIPALNTKIPAHRASFIININHNYYIPEGIYICHDCDNPSCVNFWHLFVGDYLINMKDKYHKGRVGKPGTKFNIEMARKIRKNFVTRKYTITDISERLECSHSAISCILNGVTYKDVDDGLQEEIDSILRMANKYHGRGYLNGNNTKPTTRTQRSHMNNR